MKTSQLLKSIMTFLLVWLLILPCAKAGIKHYMGSGEEKIKVEITKETTRQEVEKISQELKAKGINLVISKLRYDRRGAIGENKRRV